VVEGTTGIEDGNLVLRAEVRNRVVQKKSMGWNP